MENHPREFTDPAVKYRDRVDPDHRRAMEAIGMAWQLLAAHRAAFRLLIDAERRAHSIGPIADPTLYRDMIHSKSFAQQLQLVAAAERFLDDVAGVVEALGQQTPPDQPNIQSQPKGPPHGRHA